MNDINPLEWALPETKSLLERQFKKKPSLVKEKPQTIEKVHGQKKKRPPSDLISGSKIFKWLHKNSLEKLKLTIFDVLHGESVETNKLVVDELFNAKIWTEVYIFL